VKYQNVAIRPMANAKMRSTLPVVITVHGRAVENKFALSIPNNILV